MFGSRRLIRVAAVTALANVLTPAYSSRVQGLCPARKSRIEDREIKDRWQKQISTKGKDSNALFNTTQIHEDRCGFCGCGSGGKDHPAGTGSTVERRSCGWS
jgi:hypothetical protein